MNKRVIAGTVNFRDLRHRSFNGWRVTGLADVTPGGQHWWCRCRCGNVKRCHGQVLLRGRVPPCARCTERVRALRGSRTPEYRAWMNMQKRCYEQKGPRFRDYGGRGIAVCARWRESFEAFLADVGPRPTPWHSLDRFPNNDGNYAPGNVRWATRSEQQRNRRDNYLVTYEGRTQCLAAWAIELGFSQNALRGRLRKHPVAVAFSLPRQRRPRPPRCRAGPDG